MKTMLMIGGVVAVMAAGAFFLAQKVIVPRFKPGNALHTEEETKSEEKAHEKPAAKAREESAKVPAHGESGGKEAGQGEVYLVSNLLVNPTGTEGTRFLSATLGLETTSPETAATLKVRDVQVRDLLLSILSARTVEELTDTGSRDAMRVEILERLNKLIGKDQLSAVYFVDYVLQ